VLAPNPISSKRKNWVVDENVLYRNLSSIAPNVREEGFRVFAGAKRISRQPCALHHRFQIGVKESLSMRAEHPIALWPLGH